MNAPWHLLTRGHPLLAWRWLRSDLARWLTGYAYHRSGRADRVTSQFWAGWDTGTEGNLTVDLPYLQDGYPGADLVPLPPWECTPQLVTTLNLPAQVSSRPTVSDPEGAMGVNAPHLGGESDSPGSHELPAPRAGGHKPPLREDDQGWESSTDPGDPATVAAVSHGRQSALAGDRSLESGSLSSRITGRTLAGATAGQASADSGLMAAVTEHIAAALGVPSRTRWLDEAFDRVLLDLHAEMAILDHRYAYRELVAA